MGEPGEPGPRWMGERRFLGCLRCREVLKWAGGEEQAAPLPLVIIRALSRVPDAKSGLWPFMNNAPVPHTDGCRVDPRAPRGHKPTGAAVARPPAGPRAGLPPAGVSGMLCWAWGSL